IRRATLTSASAPFFLASDSNHTRMAGHIFSMSLTCPSAPHSSGNKPEQTMKAQLKTIAVVALVAPVMAACATKGFVRENLASGLATQKAYTDSSVSTERTARMAADSSLSTDVASLRKDLDSLRTEFGAKITALESGLQFAMPVHFAFDDATVRDEDHDALDRFAKIAQKYYPGSTITVEGFADPAGSQRYNVKLSERR